MSKRYSIEFKYCIVKLILEDHWRGDETDAFNMPAILPL